ncbi:replicative helicase loader/inhibitor [Peribacillus tepidiphilus]|uniref:replicative helicase loader/inhibitor n=1 Tax=Peribacillus tepidiphilus TaxID=2652445 RepID=UPI001292896D|nr:replicative helicase loader/inhibitor [Peribacillus tepidiphilus]
MTKREVFILLGMIAEYYEQFQLDQKRVDAWYEALKDCSFDRIKNNLLAFVVESAFPPKISDLVRKTSAVSRFIPSYEETKSILYTNQQLAKEECIQEELAKMREILGIRRDL